MFSTNSRNVFSLRIKLSFRLSILLEVRQPKSNLKEQYMVSMMQGIS